MKALAGLLCEICYRLLKKITFILTKRFDIHILRTIDFVVTYKCNSRCIMCDIWRADIKQSKDIPLERVEQILGTGIFKRTRTFAITGGEPFLRQDLHEIYRLIKQKFPSTKVIISTNGFLENSIKGFLEGVAVKQDIDLIISLDSIKKTDNIKGVKNSFKKILGTIHLVKSRFPNVRLFVKFTIMPWNYDEILDVYELSKKEKVRFLIKAIENLSNYVTIFNHKEYERKFLFDYYKKEVVLKQLKTLRRDQLRRMSFRDSAFTKELIRYFSNEGYTLSSCTSPYYSAFVMQNGDVYSCRSLKPVGNVYRDSIEQIWNSKVAELVRHSKCGTCISHYGYYNGLI